MNAANSIHSQTSSPAKPIQLNLQQTFSTLQNHCSGLLHNISTSLPRHRNPLSLVNPIQSSLKTHLESALVDFGNQAKHAFETGIRSFGSNPHLALASFGSKNPAWARIAEKSETQFEQARRAGSAMSAEAIEERLAGVPVYALSNSAGEFVLVSGVRSGKSLGLFCFKEEDAEALLEQMQMMDPAMRGGSKVVGVALNKVFQLKVDGVAFRLIPEPSQVKNALREKQKAGVSDEGFSGVPVFQVLKQCLIQRTGLLCLC